MFSFTSSKTSMDSFDGFTDEDIQRLSDKSDDIERKDNIRPPVSKNVQRHRNRLPQKNVTRERILKKHHYSTQNAATFDIPNEARLHIQRIPEDTEEDDDVVVRTMATKDNISKPTINVETTNKSKSEAEAKLNLGSTLNEEKEKMSSTQHFLNAEANDEALEAFENRQRLMEEQNKQRKEILVKAIADRARRTQEETKRLNEIEGELKKLDLLLSNDVAILRNQIESASLEFAEAQKRYDRAEKEFLDAKLDMFNKKERKELLTGHLCTIIEQNEMRKAKRLSDLMMKLEFGSKSLMSSNLTVEMKTEKDDASSNQDKTTKSIDNH